MKTERNTAKNIKRIILGTVIILLIPLLAMVFQIRFPDPGSTAEVPSWSLGDFIIIGTLLLGTGFTYELVASKVKNPGHRIMLAAGLALLVVVIWAELAVGLFGSPFAGS